MLIMGGLPENSCSCDTFKAVVRDDEGYKFLPDDLVGNKGKTFFRWFELGLTIPETMLLSGHNDMTALMGYAHSNNECVKYLLC